MGSLCIHLIRALNKLSIRRNYTSSYIAEVISLLSFPLQMNHVLRICKQQGWGGGGGGVGRGGGARGADRGWARLLPNLVPMHEPKKTKQNKKKKKKEKKMRKGTFFRAGQCAALSSFRVGKIQLCRKGSVFQIVMEKTFNVQGCQN